MKNDIVNNSILSCLEENARMSNAEIGRRVITSPAVSENKNEDIGVIKGYRAQLSHSEIGFQLKAIIILVAFMGKLKPFIEMVKT